MSEDIPQAPETIEVEGLLILNDNKSGSLLDPTKGWKDHPSRSFCAKRINPAIQAQKGILYQGRRYPGQGKAEP